MKRLLCALLTLVMLVVCVPVTAVAAPVARSKMDQIMKDWNATTYSKNKNNQYKSSSQCAAFSRYAFVRLYGHTDQLACKDVIVTVKTYTKSGDLLKDLTTKATPGDAIRLTCGKSTHIFHLYDIDSAGKITIYESNVDGKTNKAFCNTYTVESLVKSGTGAKADKGKFTAEVEMKIIHSKKNTAAAGSFSGVKPCSHSYYGGICKKCGYEYPYKVTAEKAAAYKVTKSGGSPVWSRPYSQNSTKISTIARNTYVVVIGSATNVNEKGKPENKWYLLSDGRWIYSGNVKKDSMPKNVRYVKYDDGLNMRAGASSSTKKIDVIPNGGMVTVNPAKTSGNWVYVKYHAKGISGWVSSKYLTATAPKP